MKTVKGLRGIITEVLNEGIEGCLIPNEYAKKKISQVLTEIERLILRCIGAYKIGYADEGDSYGQGKIDGYNIAKEQIRKQLLENLGL